MRASRLVALLVWLQQRGGTATAAELAAELEVSVRTVYRDVAALGVAGVPVWTETGPGGGIRLLEGWRTRLDGLTGDEASALFMGAGASAAAELGLGTVLASAQTKLLATLPADLRRQAERVRSRFLLDAPDWFHREESVPHLAAIARAVWTDRVLQLDYRRGDGVVTRTVQPLALILKAGTWYLVADSAGQPRTYRVSRVAAAAVLAESFTRPPSFDLARWWAASSASFNESILRGRVTLRLSSIGQRLLGHFTDHHAAAAALATGLDDADGWRTVELAVESERVALSQLVALGAEVEVLAPSSLRAALAELGQAIAARNAV